MYVLGLTDVLGPNVASILLTRKRVSMAPSASVISEQSTVSSPGPKHFFEMTESQTPVVPAAATKKNSKKTVKICKYYK